MEPEKNVSVCILCAHTPICKNQPQQSCPYLQLKEKKPPIELQAPAKPNRSFWRTSWRWCVRIAVVICMLLSFMAGRFSLHPRFVSIIPNIPRAIPPEMSPEQVVKELFEAMQHRDTDRALAVSHPDLKTDNYWLLDLIEDGQTADIREIKIVNLAESVIVSVVLIGERSTIDHGDIVLKKYQGEWRIANLSGL